MVMHKDMWPHELIHTVAGKLTIYNELSAALFIIGYLAVMDLEK